MKKILKNNYGSSIQKLFKYNWKAVFCLPLFLLTTGCGMKSNIEFGNKINVQMERKEKEVINFWEDNKIETDKKMSLELIMKGISDEAKVKIDQWIEKNNLNKYGDSKNLMYARGTPLFNESNIYGGIVQR